MSKRTAPPSDIEAPPPPKRHTSDNKSSVKKLIDEDFDDVEGGDPFDMMRCKCDNEEYGFHNPEEQHESFEEDYYGYILTNPHNPSSFIIARVFRHKYDKCHYRASQIIHKDDKANNSYKPIIFDFHTGDMSNHTNFELIENFKATSMSVDPTKENINHLRNFANPTIELDTVLPKFIKVHTNSHEDYTATSPMYVCKSPQL